MIQNCTILFQIFKCICFFCLDSYLNTRIRSMIFQPRRAMKQHWRLCSTRYVEKHCKLYLFASSFITTSCELCPPINRNTLVGVQLYALHYVSFLGIPATFNWYIFCAFASAWYACACNTMFLPKIKHAENSWFESFQVNKHKRLS